MCFPRSGVVILLALSSAAAAQPVVLTVNNVSTSGSGFPSPSSFPPATFSSSGGSGGGSTGAGVASAQFAVSSSAVSSTLALTGSAATSSFISFSKLNFSGSSTFTVQSPAQFQVTNNSTQSMPLVPPEPFNPVTLTAVTGSIQGNPAVSGTLAPGQYRVSFSLSVSGSGFNGQQMDWSIGFTGLPCYANCDGSTSAPTLNALDFACFLNRYVAGEAYANCDSSTNPPTLNALDFSCFLQRYQQGCP